MPTYDYQCRACGAVTEVIHSMLEDGPSVCEQCGGELRRVLYPAGIIFKGSGFYTTDSRAAGGGSGSSASTSSTGTGSGSGSAKEAGTSGSSSSSASGGSTESTPASKKPTTDAATS